MIKARAVIDRQQIDQANLTLSITMPVNEWRDLQKISDGKGWPLWPLSNLIREALSDLLNATDKIALEPSDKSSEAE